MRAADRVCAVVDARLEHVALVPDQLVAGPHGAAAQEVRLGSGAEGEVHAERALVGIGPKAYLFVRPHDLDAGRTDVGRVRVAGERTGMATGNGHASDPAHLKRLDLLALGVGRHGQDDDVAERLGPMGDEEVALPPMAVVGLDAREGLGYLMHEVLVHGGEQTGRHAIALSLATAITGAKSSGK